MNFVARLPSESCMLVIPMFHNLTSSLLCGTLSKALQKSILLLGGYELVHGNTQVVARLTTISESHIDMG